MTIEERANKIYCKDGYVRNMADDYKRIGYIQGATEQKQIDINKACRWLHQHSEEYIYTYSHTPKCMKPDFVTDFEQALKGE